MALFGVFSGKKEEPAERYIIVKDSKQVKVENPLRAMLPAIYAQKPCDDFAMRDEILEDADRVTRDFLHACRLPLETLPKVIHSNFEVLLNIPVVYDLFVALKRQKITTLYENNFSLQALVQACAFYTKTEFGQDIADNLMLFLFGISMRHLGFHSLKRDEKDLFMQCRQWDVTDARQKSLRDQFLKRYRVAADKMASSAIERLGDIIGKEHTLSKEQYKELFQIVRYSTRMMGRTAEQIKGDTRESIYASTTYIAMCYNIASAWCSKKKRIPLILAEEWGRSRQSFSQKTTNDRASQNMQALSDLFRICRCTIIPNFQGNGTDAIYSTTDNILVKEVDVVAELKEGSDTSVRRFVHTLGSGGGVDRSAGKRTAADIRSRLREGEKDALEVNRSLIMKRWQCFRSKRAIQYQSRSLMEAIEKDRRQTDDPSDSELEPLD
ncbi:MAG: hypothetical protein JXR97_16240 [Planctomycetes bacterium]|nr:hypothetical protein [Planctomycetota bacterium]